MIKPDIDQGLGQGYPFSLSTAQVAHRLLQVMDIQLGQDLLHFHLKIPGIQVVHFAEEFTQG